MKFRFYVTDIGMGNVFGTNSEEVARDYAQSEEHFVVDSENGVWFLTNGEEQEIERDSQ